AASADSSEDEDIESSDDMDFDSESDLEEYVPSWRFVPSTRGGVLLIIDGYRYWRRPSSKKIRYICSTQGCNSSAYTNMNPNSLVPGDEELEPQSVGNHDHSPHEISGGWNSILQQRIHQACKSKPFSSATAIYAEAVKVIPKDELPNVHGP
ncbi:hypothetical protein FOZ63_020600, partial [Perkinsus olseni]